MPVNGHSSFCKLGTTWFQHFFSFHWPIFPDLLVLLLQGNVPLSSPGYSGPSVMSSPIAIFVAESLQKMPAQIALTGGFK
jgi:hypothetical protein